MQTAKGACLSIYRDMSPSSEQTWPRVTAVRMYVVVERARREYLRRGTGVRVAHTIPAGPCIAVGGQV